mmetsp:Transcript_5739/g.10158  ORF Transcript_5739/g.10158 Transcript_5739/m.10158 type:complete len:414 (-) Transcript_5739:29-1270(-)
MIRIVNLALLWGVLLTAPIFPVHSFIVPGNSLMKQQQHQHQQQHRALIVAAAGVSGYGEELFAAGVSGYSGYPNQFSGMSVADLKQELRTRGLKVGGRKAELIERLNQFSGGSPKKSSRRSMPPLDPSTPINGDSSAPERRPPSKFDLLDELVLESSKPPVPERRITTAKDFDMMDKDISNIFEQNLEWKAQKEAEDPDYFTKLGSQHKPAYLWIGCADARVPANEIMGEDAGSVFVVRNVANMVVATDFNVMAALQFAINVLKIPHIIVCGHYDCGGVRASIENKDHVPPLENWLRNIRDVYRLHQKELDDIDDPEDRHRRLVELNVVEQCINLFKTGAVQRRRVETYTSRKQPYSTPRIHACVFDPKVGKLVRLEVDFLKYITDLHNIYDLYSVDDEEPGVEGMVHAPEQH